MDSQHGTAGEPRDDRPEPAAGSGPEYPASSPWASPGSVPVPPGPVESASRPTFVTAPPPERGPAPPPRGPEPAPAAAHPPPPPPGPLRYPPATGPVPPGADDQAVAAPSYPPPVPFPYQPVPPPGYRETRPLRFVAAAAGFGAGVLWFLLLSMVAWSPLSLLLVTLAGLLAALGAVAVLAWRGDRGVAAGLAVATALAVAVFTFTVWYRHL